MICVAETIQETSSMNTMIQRSRNCVLAMLTSEHPPHPFGVFARIQMAVTSFPSSWLYWMERQRARVPFHSPTRFEWHFSAENNSINGLSEEGRNLFTSRNIKSPLWFAFHPLRSCFVTPLCVGRDIPISFGKRYLVTLISLYVINSFSYYVPQDRSSGEKLRDFQNMSTFSLVLTPFNVPQSHLYPDIWLTFMRRFRAIPDKCRINPFRQAATPSVVWIPIWNWENCRSFCSQFDEVVHEFTKTSKGKCQKGERELKRSDRR
jgi:hypothetical protein